MKIIPPGKKKCVWMEAGVVSYKLCDNNYDCSTCVYDQGMQIKAARYKNDRPLVQVEPRDDVFTGSWAEKMMKLPASMRKCRYMITGEVGRKLCPNAYECGNCSFDQMMQERITAQPLPVTPSTEVTGFELADGFYYHEGHTWARPEYGGSIRIGLDDFAQKLLGGLGRVELPDPGNEVRQGEVGLSVKKDGKTIRILCPVDGIVSHVNPQVSDHPDLVNQSPYKDGWLFIVEPVNLKKNLKGLYFGEDARDYFSQEREKLLEATNEDFHVAADGGESATDMLGEIEGEKWDELIKTFLKT